MSIEYYLLSKRKCDNIIRNLKEIIENYEDFFSYTAELETDNMEEIINIHHILDFKEQFVSKLNCMIQLRNICDKKIRKLCNHKFINDVIDINPEKSQNITYCEICEYSLENI